MSRDNILHKVRTALGRSAGQGVADVPPVRLRIPETPLDERIAVMRARIETLAGVTARVPDMNAAREYVRTAIAGKTALASNSPYLAECGISNLPGVTCGIHDVGEMREVSARVDIGITSANYALGDTGTLVMLELEAMGLKRVATEVSVQYVDHNLIQTDHKNPDDHLFLQSACQRFGVWFSRPGNGVSHPVHMQNFGKPGKTLLGSDSHTPAAGSPLHNESPGR